jgi:ectoine hydroxylase-related dioxygenase (phytanoyl-CoA dioxygenase family)|tara:strand:+ start:13738 stop:14418 length:681 start_codon:yes stop_codon:yes gene_type:complete
MITTKPQLYCDTPQIISYDTDNFPFRETVAEMLEVSPEDLVRLHEFHTHELQQLGSDQHTVWHKRYYEKQEKMMMPLVAKFSKYMAEYFEKDALVYQVKPTFRIHEVGNLGVGAWHRDRDYNHDSNEVNLWIPFTPTYDTNTIWTESEEGKEDFKPMNISYGQVLVFDGANLLHGNHTNETPTTRVSFDMRVVDESRFNPTGKNTVNKQKKFELGSYFESTRSEKE